MFIRSLGLLVSLLLCFYAQYSASDQSVTDSLSCPNAELFSGKLFTDVCWACLFPIRIAGVSITPGDAPSGASSAIHEPHLPPDGASIYRGISGEQFHGSSAS